MDLITPVELLLTKISDNFKKLCATKALIKQTSEHSTKQLVVIGTLQSTIINLKIRLIELKTQAEVETETEAEAEAEAETEAETETETKAEAEEWGDNSDECEPYTIEYNTSIDTDCEEKGCCYTIQVDFELGKLTNLCKACSQLKPDCLVYSNIDVSCKNRYVSDCNMYCYVDHDARMLTMSCKTCEERANYVI